MSDLREALAEALAAMSPATSVTGYLSRDRTKVVMQTAHVHIIKNFEKLEDGDVVDVQYILGETDAPKISEGLS